MEVIEDTFGIFEPEPGNPQSVQRFTLKNPSGFTAQVITYGAAVTSLQVPGKDGLIKDVVWGFDDMDGYLLPTNRRFGATIGRTANRIHKGQFNLDGVDYQLSLNDGENHIHGGISGFNQKLWKASVTGSRVTMTYLSGDGEEGYPGDVLAQVTYEVTLTNELVMEYLALSTAPSPVVFTNHAYFNLSGHENSTTQLANQFVTIYADSITPVDDNQIITGEIRSVDGTIYDLRARQDLHQLLQQFPAGPYGFDNNYCLINNNEMVLAARVEEIEQGRIMEVYTDQPGVQFYTSNAISESVPVVGKDGAQYVKHGALCLETQNYPDAVNHDNFPNPIIRPGEIYSKKVIYKFLVPLDK